MRHVLLPEFYRDVFPESALRLKSHEPSVNCFQCNKSGTFLSDTKCCTYQPFLANFHVGALIASKPDVAERVLSKAKESHWFLPIGLVPTSDYRKLYKEKEFGKSTELKCSFVSQGSGLCDIWDYRDSQCRTYFCEGDNNYWSSVRDYLYQWEMSILQLVLVYKGEDADIQAQLDLLTSLDLLPTQELNENSFEFYKDCFTVFEKNKMSWKDEISNNIDLS